MAEQDPGPSTDAPRKAKLHPGDALIGYFDMEPKYKLVGEDQVPKVYARVGVDHYRRDPGGRPVKAGTTFHHLTAFREAAERISALFTQGDRFIARGYVHPYTNRHGAQDEEFIATHIGHDALATDYAVFRDLEQQPARRKPPAIDRSPEFSSPPRGTPTREPETLSR